MVISGFQELKRRLGNISPVPAVVAAANDRHTLQAVLDAIPFWWGSAAH